MLLVKLQTSRRHQRKKYSLFYLKSEIIYIMMLMVGQTYIFTAPI
jgi:hypothetical protein